MKLFKPKPTQTPEQRRGIRTDYLKWHPTGNLTLLAIAMLLEQSGVDDRELINELYKRARGDAKKP